TVSITVATIIPRFICHPDFCVTNAQRTTPLPKRCALTWRKGGSSRRPSGIKPIVISPPHPDSASVGSTAAAEHAGPGAGKLRAQQEDLGRIEDPEQQDDQRPRRPEARGDVAAAD